MRPSSVETSEPALHEAEDIVDEEEHVLVFDVAEVLRHRQGRERDPEAHAGRLVHLPEDERGLLDNARLLHLEPEVGPLACALTHAGEDGHTTVLLGHAIDHLEDEHCLADAGPAEEADLAALDVGLEQVDDLDPRLEHLGPGLQGVERRGRAMDLPTILGLVDVVGVERPAGHVEDVAEDGRTDGHGDATAGVADDRAPAQPVGGLQADAAHPTLADLLGHLRDDRGRRAFELDVKFHRVVDLGQGPGRELDVDHGTADGDDPAVLQFSFLSGGGGRVGDGGHSWLSF